MSIKAVLFDLDGTLLPMDQDVFLKAYLGALSHKLAPLGYDSKLLVDAIWLGTAAMIKNNGESTNEKVFWKEFCTVFGNKALNDIPIFDDFYHNEFQSVRDVCGFDDAAVDIVRYLKTKEIRVALATNPIFPLVATESRVRWSGLDVNDFELCTTYENSVHSKPNPEYYRDILREMDIEPSEALMVGNDVSDDMVAKNIGMKVFLLTNCLINRTNQDISVYPQGDFEQLKSYINSVI